MPAKGSGKYIYKDDKKNPYHYSLCPICGEVKLMLVRSIYCSRACMGKGRDYDIRPKDFKGPRVLYNRYHDRVRRARGKADHCINGCEATRFHWANMTGNYEDVNDYQQMCPKCHAEFDRERELH